MLPPGFGDSVQASKAGLLEVGDIFVVNQADRPGADDAVRRLREMLELGVRGEWQPPVVATVATEGEGVVELRRAVAAHEAHVRATPGRGLAPARALLRSALQEAFAVAAETVLDGADAGRLVERIAGRSIDPWSAARELMEGRG